jgi:hypothetical protein
MNRALDAVTAKPETSEYAAWLQRRAAAGDQTAFERLIDEHERKLRDCGFAAMMSQMTHAIARVLTRPLSQRHAPRRP